MRYKRLKLLGIILCGLGWFTTNAQNAISASGAEVVSESGKVSYSVGQIAITTIVGDSGSVSQGVQQAYIVSVIEDIIGLKDIELSVYPNPTSTYVSLSVGSYDKDDLTYKLYDIKGKIIKAGLVSGSDTRINMQNYLPAIYFIKVVNSKQEVKTFKIIKN